MALWKEQVAPKKESVTFTTEPPVMRDPAPAITPSASPDYQRRPAARETTESVIGSNITIEGKIDGSGHVRIAGRFKGDVHVEGDLTIEAGATLTGGVKANAVVIGGELDGNVIDAGRVELLETGILNGDLKAGSLTVAAGSRMRGRVEFGWAPKDRHTPSSSEGQGDNNGGNGAAL